MTVKRKDKELPYFPGLWGTGLQGTPSYNGLFLNLCHIQDIPNYEAH